MYMMPGMNITNKDKTMDNIELQEKLAIHTLRQLAESDHSLMEDLAGEYTLEGGIAQFLKDALKFLARIKKLQNDQEIVIDTVDPTGFVTVYNNEGTYELSIALVGEKTRQFESKNAGQIIGKVISIFKDQLLVGRKNYKAKYGK